MTTALCLNCGETKFGAWCPCGNCRVESSGDRDLDILFSDHRMAVSTLKRFGGIIKQLAARCDDPEIRFWAFISYLSSHPAELLSASPPPEIAERVEKLLAEAQLPIFDAQLKPAKKEIGPPQKTIPFPDTLFQQYIKAEKLLGIQRVQVRRTDGVVINGTLMALEESPMFMLNADVEMLPEEIVAIRTAPGCLTGWLINPKWIEAS